MRFENGGISLEVSVWLIVCGSDTAELYLSEPESLSAYSLLCLQPDTSVFSVNPHRFSSFILFFSILTLSKIGHV